MMSVDTTVLVRLLLDDAEYPAQALKARKMAIEAKQLYVPQFVVVDLISVLEYKCGLERDGIINVLEHMIYNSAFVIQREAQIVEALHLFEKKKLQFPDCLLVVESNAANTELLTFNTKIPSFGCL